MSSGADAGTLHDRMVRDLESVAFGPSKAVVEPSNPYTPYVPRSFTFALVVAMCVVGAITLSGIAALFLVGFRVPWFTLDPIVLASMVGGMSIQSAAAVVSPLAKGIAEVIKEQYKSGAAS